MNITKEQAEKGIEIINIVSNGITDGHINTDFMQRVFYGQMDKQEYDHIISKWKGKEGDFFDFYLNVDDEIQRLILQGLDIVVEADKYPDYISRVQAQIFGKKDLEVFPFEIAVLQRYCLFGNNHSLDVLKTISKTAFKVLLNNDIELYGNFKNWSLFWINATLEDKTLLLNHIVTETYKH